MGEGDYHYSPAILAAIAAHYPALYSDGIEPRGGLIINPWALAEYKTDFDSALNSVGRGRWPGQADNNNFDDFRYFSRYQRVIIADIYGITDFELKGRGIAAPGWLRRRAYRVMAKYLNGETK